jgi:hypothetical protein
VNGTVQHREEERNRWERGGGGINILRSRSTMVT